MSKRGRPPAQQAKTAYDYRRYIVLVQALAMRDPKIRNEAIHHLVDEWLPDVKHRTPHLLGIDYLLHLLAEHAIEYHKTPGGLRDETA